MSGIINKISEILKELEQYQNEPLILNDKLDAPLFNDVIQTLTQAIQDKNSDLEISSTTLEAVRTSCSAFNHPAVNALVFEQLRPFCDAALQDRKRMAKAIFEFIDDFKALRNPSHLNLSCYDPEIFSLLPQLLQQTDIMNYLRTTEFEAIFSTIKASHFFNNQDLRACSLTSMRHVERLFKGLLLSEQTVKPACHLGGEYRLDPVVLTRFRAQERYRRNAQSAPTSPVKKEVISTPLSRSLPNTPKDELPSPSSSSSSSSTSSSMPAPTSIPTHTAAMPAERSPVVPLLQLDSLRRAIAPLDLSALHLGNSKNKSKHSCK